MLIAKQSLDIEARCEPVECLGMAEVEKVFIQEKPRQRPFENIQEGREVCLLVEGGLKSLLKVAVVLPRVGIMVDLQ